jgi:hypothetical protein
MKKLLLTGIAALSVLTASAAQATVKRNTTVLPDKFLGNWCVVSDDDPQQTILERTPEECDSGLGSMNIRQNSSTDFIDACEFNTIEQSGPEAYQIHATCENVVGYGDREGSISHVFWEIKIIGEQLIITELSEG